MPSKSEKRLRGDFLIDLPMVFSVVSVDDLVKSANEFYGRNIILPKAGSSFDSRTQGGELHEFHLYKITTSRLDRDEMSMKKNVSGFETIMQKMGVFNNLYDIMNEAQSVTIFSNVNDADIFLKAWLKFHTESKQKEAYIYSESEIEGLDNL